VIDLDPAARFGLLLVRPSMVVMLAPAFGGLYTPSMVKIGLIVMLAIGLFPSVGIVAAAGDVGLAVIVARELAIGMALGLVTRTLIIAAEFAGHLAGFQIGFSYGATVDPATGVRNTMIASLYGMMAVLTFLGVNGHHDVLRSLALSYTGMPIGGGHIDASLVSSVKQILGLVFTVAVRLAAPVVIVLLVLELGVGLISRTAPSLSFMVIGYPLRLIVGLGLMAALIGTVPGVVATIVGRVISLALTTAAAFR
jgi:flagellar biosynthetic protein FliR